MDYQFESKMKHWIELIENGLNEYVSIIENPQKIIYEAMRYSLMAGGKRIRPVLAFASAEVLGVDANIIKPFACSLEMIHTYSLIHDDLPGMDDDEMRRGRPTCHKQYNVGLAILAGDALLNKAFETMGQAVVEMQDVKRGIAMLNCVAKLSGTQGMIGGQVVDIETENKVITKEILEYTYMCKTGALLKAPVLISIEAAGVSGTDEAKHLERYAEIIGLAFQVKDDILDVTGDSIKMGKANGRDKKENKTTFVSIYGLDYCLKYLESLTVEAIEHGKWFSDKGQFLVSLAEFLLKRDS